MNGVDNSGFADDVKQLRRDLADLKEMVRLGASIPGDEQRIEMIKGLLARWHKIDSVTLLDAVAPKPGIDAGAAGGKSARADDMTIRESAEIGWTEEHGQAAIITP